FSFKGSLVGLRVRASNDHFLILQLLHRGQASRLHCAHRATTVLSWGLCEQEGWLAAPSHPSERARASSRRTARLPSLLPLRLMPHLTRCYDRFRVEEPMPNILLLVSPSCGACPSAKSLWKQLRVKYSFSYREVDITTEDGKSLADRHSVRA